MLLLAPLLVASSAAAQEGPDRELRSARAAYASDSSTLNRLRAGLAELQARNDSVARRLLAPLGAAAGRIGATARRGLAELAVREALRNERALDPATFPPRSVGVTPFHVASDDTTLTPLGAGLADLLLTDLARSARLDVVERAQVHALLRELALARSGAVDSGSAPRAGRLLGARTGEAISSAAALDRVLDTEKALAFRVFDALGVTLTPAERRAVEQRHTRDVGAFLAYARAVHDEIVGDHLAAARGYAAALDADPGFALAAERLADLPEGAVEGTSLARMRVQPDLTLDALLDALNPSPASALGVMSGWPVPLTRVLDSMLGGGTRPPGQ